MKCKVCGTVNEDYLEYCENCAALLPVDEVEEVAEEAAVEVIEERTAEEIYESRKGWTFVAAPFWRKVEFDANTVTEDDIPANKTIFSAPVVSLTDEDLASSVDEAAQKIAAQKEVAERAAVEAAKRAARICSASVHSTAKRRHPSLFRRISRYITASAVVRVEEL